nr:hypothetical protein [Tanacetum cinerariifolium]
MLEKDMYDSWRSRMELYMLNRQHSRMIVESVEHGPLLWLSFTEDGVTRLKNILNCHQLKLFKPIAMLKQQISFFKHFLWRFMHWSVRTRWLRICEQIQMLMQGTSLTKQERKCKLYDAFDKFTYQKGETLRDFYLRFLLLLNDMNMYNMKLEQF